MVPILYDAGEQAFTSNGLGRLAECTSCVVTEARNGEYELEFTYPLTGRMFDKITLGRIVACTHDDKHDVQPFVIYQRSAPLGGVVTYNARHISYELSTVVVDAFTAGSALEALPAIKTHSINANRFNFSTDLTTLAVMSVDQPTTARSLLGGTEGSVLDTYGGEYEFNRFDVILHAHRGTSSGVVLRYGKNLTDLKQVLDGSGIYNAVVPFWAKEEDGTRTVVTLPERIVTAEGVTDPLAIPLDLSQDFEDQPTEAQLRTAAQQHLAQREPWVPDENISLDFINLSQTDEYRDVYNLQRLSLCDKVDVVYTALGVVARDIEIIKVTYDVLREMYTKMELGKARSTFAQIITEKTEEQISQAETELRGFFDDAIDAATDLLKGVNGGHVVYVTDSTGKPQEILILDTESAATATNILRINLNGIGFSQDGGRTYSTAWTLDGRFVADFITTGTLKAITIQGPTALTFWDLGTGVFQSYGTKSLTSTIQTSDSTQETVTYTVESKTRLDGGELTVEGKKTTDTETTVFSDAGLQSDDIDFSFYEQIPRDLPHASLVYPHGGLISRGDHVQSFGGTGRNQYPADVDNVRYNPKGILTPDYVQLGEAEGPTFADGDYEGESYPDTVDRNILRLSGGWAERREAILFKKYVDVAYSPQGVVRDFFSPPIICRPAWDIALREDIEQESVLAVAWLTSNKTKLQFFFPLNRPVSEDVVSFEIAFTLHRAYTATGTGVVTSDQECFSGSGIIHPVSVSFGDFGMRVIVEKVDGSWSAGSNNGFLLCELNDVWFRAIATDPYIEE